MVSVLAFFPSLREGCLKKASRTEQPSQRGGHMSRR